MMARIENGVVGVEAFWSRKCEVDGQKFSYGEMRDFLENFLLRKPEQIETGGGVSRWIKKIIWIEEKTRELRREVYIGEEGKGTYRLEVFTTYGNGADEFEAVPIYVKLSGLEGGSETVVVYPKRWFLEQKGLALQAWDPGKTVKDLAEIVVMLRAGRYFTEREISSGR